MSPPGPWYLQCMYHTCVRTIAAEQGRVLPCANKPKQIRGGTAKKAHPTNKRGVNIEAVYSRAIPDRYCRGESAFGTPVKAEHGSSRHEII